MIDEAGIALLDFINDFIDHRSEIIDPQSRSPPDRPVGKATMAAAPSLAAWPAGR